MYTDQWIFIPSKHCSLFSFCISKTLQKLSVKKFLKTAYKKWYCQTQLFSLLFSSLLFRYELKWGFRTWLQNYKQMRISNRFPAVRPRSSTGNATKKLSLEHDLNIQMRKGIQYCIKLSLFFLCTVGNHSHDQKWWALNVLHRLIISAAEIPNSNLP